MPAEIYNPVAGDVATGSAGRADDNVYCSPFGNDPYFDGYSRSRFSLTGLINSILVGMKKSADNVNGLVKNPDKVQSYIITWGIALLSLPMVVGMTVVAKFTEFLPTPSGCDVEEYRRAVSIRAAIKILNVLPGMVPPELLEAADRRVRVLCPQVTPSLGELNTMRLRGFISDKSWKFGIKMAGVCEDWANAVYKTSQVVYTIPEIFKLWNQGWIVDEKLPAWLRANGVISDKLMDGYKNIYEVVPSLSDCMTAMEKNTEDREVQDAWGLNDDFDERFTGNIKLWANRSGYTEQMLRFLWRTQRRTVDQRIILRLYRGGQTDEAGMVSLFRMSGYSRKLAEKLAAGIIRLYGPAKAVFDGLPALKELESAYTGGVIDEQAYRDNLLAVGVPADLIDNHVSTANTRRQAATVKRQQALLKRAYLKGRVADDDLPQRFQSIGIVGDVADQLRADWQFEKSLTNRQLEISKLCKLVGQGYLTIDDYKGRAKNLGFNELDAVLMAQSCTTDILEKRQLEAEKQQRKALAEAEKGHRKYLADQRAMLRAAKSRYPCKEKSKPDCPPGVHPPDPSQVV